MGVKHVCSPCIYLLQNAKVTEGRQSYRPALEGEKNDDPSFGSCAVFLSKTSQIFRPLSQEQKRKPPRGRSGAPQGNDLRPRLTGPSNLDPLGPLGLGLGLSVGFLGFGHRRAP
jgi:hypothetical protein